MISFHRVCVVGLSVSVAGLVLSVAGTALGQPVVNGKLKPEYGPIQWSNTTPTGFGDAGPAVAPACDPIGAGVQITLNNSNRAGVSGGTGAGDTLAAGAVSTGYEIKIPLASLGLDVSNNGANLPEGIVVGVAGWVCNYSNDFTHTSNQFIGGLGGITGSSVTTYPNPNNYPPPRTVDLDQVPGHQYILVSIPKATLLAMTPGTEPILDGTKDASYGGSLFEQDVQTNYGDATTAQGGADTIFRCQGGSEVDAAFGRFGRDAGGELAVYVVIAGNFESNHNKLVLFFDSIAGGQNQLTRNSATQTGIHGAIFGGGANAFAAAGADPGLKFDAAFAADFFLSVNVGGGGEASPSIFADWQRISPSTTDAGSARFIGNTNATSNGGILTASDPCPPFVAPDYHDYANGSEIDGLYAMVCGSDPDPTKNYLYILVTGNLESTGNRLDLFFDAGSVSVPFPSAGQQQLLGNAHPFDFNHLNRLGRDPVAPTASPGLKFSNGFAPDYWVSMEIQGSPGYVNTWAGLINIFGAANDANDPPSYLEYGSFAGGPKATNDPLVFDGLKCVRTDAMNACAPNGFNSPYNTADSPPGSGPAYPGLDIQGNEINALPVIFEPYASFAPRLISADVYDPRGAAVGAAHPNLAVAGLLSTSIDNSNHGGVTGADASRSKQVTTGLEVKVRLDEIGWTGTGPIRVGGFIVSQDHTILSNQVIGGTLPAMTNNLNEPRTLDFTALAPTESFYVEISPGTCATVATSACCFDATTCALMSSAQCAGAGGTTMAGTCSPSPCGAPPASVCCRGATCNTTYGSSAACSGSLSAGALAGAAYATASACNDSGNPATAYRSPCCFADYNKSGALSTADIFDFLNDWFAGRKYAIVGGNGETGTLSTNDIFAFLNAWFGGGC